MWLNASSIGKAIFSYKEKKNINFKVRIFNYFYTFFLICTLKPIGDFEGISVSLYYDSIFPASPFLSFESALSSYDSEESSSEAFAQSDLNVVRHRNLTIDLVNRVSVNAQLPLPATGEGPYPGISVS